MDPDTGFVLSVKMVIGARIEPGFVGVCYGAHRKNGCIRPGLGLIPVR